VSFVVINLCVTSKRAFVVVVYFVIDSVRKLLDIHSRMNKHSNKFHSKFQGSELEFSWLEARPVARSK
jgi:hypothetical protein